MQIESQQHAMSSSHRTMFSISRPTTISRNDWYRPLATRCLHVSWASLAYFYLFLIVSVFARDICMTAEPMFAKCSRKMANGLQ